MLLHTTNTLAQYAPWLLTIFAKSALLLLVALAAAKVMHRGSASLRHFLYAVTIVGVLILPLASALLPSLGIAVLPHRQKADRAETVVIQPRSQPAVEAPVASAASRSHRLNHAEAKSNLTGRSTISQNESLLSAKVKPAAEARQSNQVNWQGALVLVWISGCAVCLLRMAAQQLHLR